MLYLAGLNRYYGPPWLGGKAEALALLLAAEKLFEAEAAAPAASGAPRWGRATCLMYIARTYAALGNRAAAEAYFRKARDLDPQAKPVGDEPSVVPVPFEVRL